jgi:hypothetical protein
MRRLRVDREDDPAPGKRKLKACKQGLPSSKPCCDAGTVVVPGSGNLQKGLAKPFPIRRRHQQSRVPWQSASLRWNILQRPANLVHMSDIWRVFHHGD